jgi:hypothetical protein
MKGQQTKGIVVVGITNGEKSVIFDGIIGSIVGLFLLVTAGEQEIMRECIRGYPADNESRSCNSEDLLYRDWCDYTRVYVYVFSLEAGVDVAILCFVLGVHGLNRWY